MHLGTALAAMFVASISTAASADFFVITGTFESQAEAQRSAAEKGGWALDTDFYESLPPNRFAVVRGPFRLAKDAQSELELLGSTYPGARIESVGPARLPSNLANAPPAVLIALLGELSIEIEERAGGGNPCEPPEPYQSIRLSYMGLTRIHDPTTDTFPIVGQRTDIDMGHFSILKRTGEVDHMRECFE